MYVCTNTQLLLLLPYVAHIRLSCLGLFSFFTGETYSQREGCRNVAFERNDKENNEVKK